MTVDAGRSGFNQKRWRSLHRSASGGLSFFLEGPVPCAWRASSNRPLAHQEESYRSGQVIVPPRWASTATTGMKGQPHAFLIHAQSRRVLKSPAHGGPNNLSAGFAHTPVGHHLADSYFGIVQKPRESASPPARLPPSCLTLTPLGRRRRQAAPLQKKAPPFCRRAVVEQAPAVSSIAISPASRITPIGSQPSGPRSKPRRHV